MTFVTNCDRILGEHCEEKKMNNDKTKEEKTSPPVDPFVFAIENELGGKEKSSSFICWKPGCGGNVDTSTLRCERCNTHLNAPRS